MNFRQIITSITLVLFYIASNFFGKCMGENYHHTFYQRYDALVSELFDWTTISIGDFLYGMLALVLIFILSKMMFKKQYKQSLIFLFQTIFIFLIVFQWSWGMNNFKIPLYKKLEIANEYSLEDLNTYAEKDLKELNELHYKITSNTDSVVSIEKDYDQMYQQANENFKNVWFLKEYATDRLTPAKASLYSFALTKAGFSGYFNPFTHENQINDEIPTIGLPVTYVHEMSHQLGFASEAEANFIAYYTLKQSSNEVMQYAAELYGFKYILKEIRKTNEEKYLFFLSQLNPGILTNIQDSEEFWKTNKNFSSNIFKPMYHLFLKANNQKDGIQSYNLMVNLMINYDKKYEN